MYTQFYYFLRIFFTGYQCNSTNAWRELFDQFIYCYASFFSNWNDLICKVWHIFLLNVPVFFTNLSDFKIKSQHFMPFRIMCSITKNITLQNNHAHLPVKNSSEINMWYIVSMVIISGIKNMDLIFVMGRIEYWLLKTLGNVTCMRVITTLKVL